MPITPPPEYPRLNCCDHVFRGLPDAQFSPPLNALLENEMVKKVLIWDLRISFYEALAQSHFLDLSANAKQIFSDIGIIVHFENPELVVRTIREAWEQSK